MPPTYRGAGTRPAAGRRPPASSWRRPGCCPQMRLGRDWRPRPLWQGPPRTSAGVGPRWTGGPRRATESTPLLGEEIVSGRPETPDPASGDVEAPSAPGTPSPRSPLSRLSQLLPNGRGPRPTFQLCQHLQLGSELVVEIILDAAQLLLVVLHTVREPELPLRISRAAAAVAHCLPRACRAPPISSRRARRRAPLVGVAEAGLREGWAGRVPAPQPPRPVLGSSPLAAAAALRWRGRAGDGPGAGLRAQRGRAEALPGVWSGASRVCGSPARGRGAGAGAGHGIGGLDCTARQQVGLGVGVGAGGARSQGRPAHRACAGRGSARTAGSEEAPALTRAAVRPGCWAWSCCSPSTPPPSGRGRHVHPLEGGSVGQVWNGLFLQA